MHSVCRCLIISALVMGSHTGLAEVLWHANTASLLYGERYRVNFLPQENDSSRGIVTLEHVSSHSWGDLFSFLDLVWSTADNRGEYLEFSPRLSFAKLFNKSWSPSTPFGIKDYLIASTIEAGHADSSRRDNQFINVLLGVGLDWKMPGLRFLQTNIYYAKNQDEDNDYQLTVAWATDFALGASYWVYDGFVDWSSAADDHHESMNWTSQLKWDLGRYLQAEAKRLYLGVEYVYWNNKYGIKQGAAPFTTDERNLNLLVKYYL